MILISQNVNTNKKYISNLAEDHVVRVKLPSFHATFENSKRKSNTKLGRINEREIWRAS